MVKQIIHLEGLALFVASLFFYQAISGNWLVFIILLLLLDISMVGYIKDKKLGALLYNLMHNYVLSLLIIGLGILLNIPIILMVGIILFAHVSLDRMFGYGLKYSSSFKDTHIQKM